MTWSAIAVALARFFVRPYRRAGYPERYRFPTVCGAIETQPLMHRDPALQRKGADLIDADALADQPLTHPVQRLAKAHTGFGLVFRAARQAERSKRLLPSHS